MQALDVDRLHVALASHADPAKAEAMAAYMKGHFPFLGVSAPLRREVQKPWIAAARKASADELLRFADACWARPERELHHVALDALRARQRVLGAEHLPRLRRLVQTCSWWDTVDALAAWTIGPLVLRNPALRVEMNAWAADPDLWVARTAVLHQLNHKEKTDEERLFRYVVGLAGHPNVFIRKALGWALRQHGRRAPDAVRAFVNAHPELSGLTRREALKHLGAA